MKTIIIFALCLLYAASSFAAGGAFQIYNNKLSFPDGSEFSTAPKDGKTIYNGSGAPTDAATTGDFYLDTANNRLYGPFDGVTGWGSGVSLGGASLSSLQETQKSICDMYAMQSTLVDPGTQTFILPAYCPPGDCAVSAWSDWSACTSACNGGNQSRSRSIIMEAYKGGAACPSLMESQSCNTQACPEGKKVFITSQRYTSNLGGLAGADAKCQSLATTAGLTGVFKAWLSDSSVSASDRLSHSTIPYVRTDGQLVANNWDGLVSSLPFVHINCNESSICSISDYVWTHTDNFGTKCMATTCSDWSTSFSGQVCVGSTNAPLYNWTTFGSFVPPSSCNGANMYRLYCFEQ